MILFCLLAALAAVLVIAVTGAVRAARGQPSSAAAAAEYERRVKAKTRTSGRGAAQRPQAPSLPVGDAVLTRAEWDEWVGIRHASNMAEASGETQ